MIKKIFAIALCVALMLSLGLISYADSYEINPIDIPVTYSSTWSATYISRAQQMLQLSDSQISSFDAIAEYITMVLAAKPIGVAEFYSSNYGYGYAVVFEHMQPDYTTTITQNTIAGHVFMVRYHATTLQSGKPQAREHNITGNGDTVKWRKVYTHYVVDGELIPTGWGIQSESVPTATGYLNTPWATACNACKTIMDRVKGISSGGGSDDIFYTEEEYLEYGAEQFSDGYSSGISAGVLQVQSNPAIYGLHTTAEYNAYGTSQYSSGRTQGRLDITSEPNEYNLFTESQYNARYESGINTVLNHPANYNLYTYQQYSQSYQSGYSDGYSAAADVDPATIRQLFDGILEAPGTIFNSVVKTDDNLTDVLGFDVRAIFITLFIVSIIGIVVLLIKKLK